MVRSDKNSGVLECYALTGWRERLKSLPDPPDVTRLLSPFDPIIRDRARALRLFSFDYRFEAFVPPPRRKYGYYVMPVLDRDQLIARVDPKLHRDRELLEIKRVWFEPGVKPTRKVRNRVEEAAHRLAKFVGATRVSIAT
jgi:uncharacterized protein YcaQ